jgi:purine-binding chemotaxis protein CheW
MTGIRVRPVHPRGHKSRKNSGIHAPVMRAAILRGTQEGHRQMSQTAASAAVAPRNVAEWNATEVARPATEPSSSVRAAPSQFISFAIGDDQYGVDIMAVREIKGWSEITHLPKQPDYVRGVLNLRGVIVPIVDLRCRFGQGLTEATPLHIVIIVQIGSRLVGLLADRVLDIVSLDASQIQPVPRIARGGRVDFLSGLVTVEGAMIALIDLANLLAQPSSDDAENGVGDSRPAAVASRR